MASNRIGRINEEIQKELSSAIRNLKDPRVLPQSEGPPGPGHHDLHHPGGDHP